MVRINLVNPVLLTDQHLVAEYNEILMLFGYVKKYPKPIGIPKEYCLGPGHIKFFKNKLKYLKKRHEIIKTEMKMRGFNPKITVNLGNYSKELVNDWNPETSDYEIIKKRIIQKISQKPQWYKYRGKKYTVAFYKKLIDNL